MLKNKVVLVGIAILLILGLVGLGIMIGTKQKSARNQLIPTPTVTPSPTVEATPSGETTALTPTAKSTLTPTVTPRPTNTPTPTPTPAVVNIETSVDPTSSDACNKVFTFTSKIYTNAATTVTYKWLRSDGATGSVQTLTFTSGGMQTVSEQWSLGPLSASSHMNGWERIEIVTPNSTLGNQAPFTLSCP